MILRNIIDEIITARSVILLASMVTWLPLDGSVIWTVKYLRVDVFVNICTYRVMINSYLRLGPKFSPYGWHVSITITCFMTLEKIYISLHADNTYSWKHQKSNETSRNESYVTVPISDFSWKRKSSVKKWMIDSVILHICIISINIYFYEKLYALFDELYLSSRPNTIITDRTRKVVELQ